MSKIVAVVENFGRKEETQVFDENEGGINITVPLPNRSPLLVSLQDHYRGEAVDLVLSYENGDYTSEDPEAHVGMTLPEGEEQEVFGLRSASTRVSVRHERE